MNKIFVFIILILSFIGVNADENIVNLNCPKEELIANEKMICDLSFNLDSNVSNINFNYDTDLNVYFVDNENIVNNDGKSISIIYKNEKNIQHLKLEIMGNNIGEAYLNLSDIKINNITSVNDIMQKFNIKEKVLLSSNNKLTDILINNVSVDGFDPLVNRYENIIVNKAMIFVDVKGKDDKAMVTGVGNVILRKNVPTEINVRVTSEDGNTFVYTLVVTYIKEIIKSRDTSIETIELYNGENRLDFVFDKNKSSFRIKINAGINKVQIKATLTDTKSKFVEGYGPREVNIDYGNNFVELRTESENGDTKIYSISIEREDNRSSDNTLKELLINDNKVDIEKNKYNYEINVLNDVTKTKVYAVPNSNKASVSYKDISLYEGNNHLTIKVTSENKKVNEYHINIIREHKIEILPDIVTDDIKEFNNIKIDGYDLNFDKNIYEYDLNVPNEIKKLKFIIKPSDSMVKILNNEDLKNESIITIKADGKEYKIRIHKEKISNINYLYYILPGLVILFLTIFAIIKKKKK